MTKRYLYAAFAISIIVFLINILAYPFLPDKVPVHWGLSGEPNRYGTRIEHLTMGALPLVFVFIFNFLPSIDPKKESYKKHSKPYSILNFLIILFLSGMNLLALGSALGFKIKFSVVLPISLGVLLIVMGNYMSQIRSNYFFGFRTPWTLASEHVWRKTHRFGGYVFIFVGLIPLLSLFIGVLAMKIFFGALLIGIGAVYFYSYFIFTKKVGK